MRPKQLKKKYIFGEPDKREVSRIKLASITTMDSSKWDLELSKPVNAPEMEKLLALYHGEELECNPFFAKTFLAASFGRMNTNETDLITVWETIDAQRFLRMYFPIVRERVGIPGTKVWRCWSHNYAPLGVPIISNHDAAEILDRFLQLLAQIEHSKFPALVFSDIPLQGAFATNFRQILTNSQTPFIQNMLAKRAILQRNPSLQSKDILEINSKMRRNYRRQLRRLGELGDLELECVSGYKDVILRFEEFMLLEAKGWKGRKGTSMHSIKQTAAFARQAITQSAKDDHCSIYSIRLNNQSITSLIMLDCDGVYFPWKIAFDQNYSLYSPGALLMFKASQAIGMKPDFLRADSLAGPNNQLVNPLWKQRMDLGSLILPIGKTSTSAMQKISNAISRKDKLANRAKKILAKMG